MTLVIFSVAKTTQTSNNDYTNKSDKSISFEAGSACLMLLVNSLAVNMVSGGT